MRTRATTIEADDSAPAPEPDGLVRVLRHAAIFALTTLGGFAVLLLVLWWSRI